MIYPRKKEMQRPQLLACSLSKTHQDLLHTANRKLGDDRLLVVDHFSPSFLSRTVRILLLYTLSNTL